MAALTVARARATPGDRLISVVAALVLVLLSAGCAGPRAVPLTELAANADYYDGRKVIAHGVVMEFGADDDAVEHHFVIQDQDVNRVQLLPNEAAEPYVGSVVEVLGEFEFDPGRGRLLHIESIEEVTADG